MRPVVLFLLALLLSACGGPPPAPIEFARPPPQEPASQEDPWAPWRQPAAVFRPPCRADAELLRAITVEALPAAVRLGAEPLTETAGHEVSWRFRLAAVPPARLEASHGLAQFRLLGDGDGQVFWLHAYSGNNGFMLNGLSTNRKPPWQEVLLARGAILPGQAPRLDRQWHRVAIAWCRGQMAVKWDDLTIFHVRDESIDYREFPLEWLREAPNVGPVEFSAFEVRRATFATE